MADYVTTVTISGTVYDPYVLATPTTAGCDYGICTGTLLLDLGTTLYLIDNYVTDATATAPPSETFSIPPIPAAATSISETSSTQSTPSITTSSTTQTSSFPSPDSTMPSRTASTCVPSSTSSASSCSSPSSFTDKPVIITGITVGSILFVLAILGIISFFYKRRKRFAADSPPTSEAMMFDVITPEHHRETFDTSARGGDTNNTEGVFFQRPVSYNHLISSPDSASATATMVPPEYRRASSYIINHELGMPQAHTGGETSGLQMDTVVRDSRHESVNDHIRRPITVKSESAELEGTS